MNHIMLDLEALGKNSEKVICQIGAIYFDPKTGETGAEFKVNIDAISHEKYGAKTDSDTVYWWLAQSDAARASILAQPRLDARVAIEQFNEFAKDAKYIWSHATFDFVTIMHMFKQVSVVPNFSYKSGLDIRTLVYLSGIQFDKIPRDGVHHDALADCKHQVKYCTEAFSKVKADKTLIAKLEKIME